MVCLLLFLAACQQQPIRGELSGSPNVNLAEQFVIAYNAHDQKQMLILAHPEIRYMYIEDDQVYTETNGKTALAEFLVGFFQNNPNAQSKLLSSHQQGSFIHQVEQAIWTDDTGQLMSQCSLSVYEIEQQLIKNVWYFTTFKCA